MRRSVLILLSALPALAVVPVASAIQPVSGPLTPVHVKPGTGGTHTRFTFSLRVPTQTGRQGSSARTDTLSVTGPRHTGCVSSATSLLPAARANTIVRVTLNPAGHGGSWCIGTFNGEVIQSLRIICSPPPVYIVCPQLVIAPQVIARFKFRVTSHG